MKKINKPTKADYIKALESGIYEVSFLKSNDELKVVVCSLIPELIPRNVIEKFINHALYSPKPTVVSAYDVQNCKWCSFKIDRITTFKKLGKLY